MDRYSVWEQLWSWCFLQADKCLLSGLDGQRICTGQCYIFLLTWHLSYWTPLVEVNEMLTLTACSNVFRCTWGWACRCNSCGEDLNWWQQNNRSDSLLVSIWNLALLSGLFSSCFHLPFHFVCPGNKNGLPLPHTWTDQGKPLLYAVKEASNRNWQPVARRKRHLGIVWML